MMNSVDTLAELQALYGMYRNAPGPDIVKVGLRAVTATDLLTMEIPERRLLLLPVLHEQDLVMIYGPRGVGKTYVSLSLALAVATGCSAFGWVAAGQNKVLYIDGEMPSQLLKQRLTDLMPLHLSKDALDNLVIISPDLQQGPMPDLSSLHGQAEIEDHLDGVKLVIVDNVSSLCRSGKENEGESWLPVQSWILGLRQRGICVILVHHAGKGGQQRGTSRKEDVLDTVIALRKPSDYEASEGARLEVHFEKSRSLYGDIVDSFELKLLLREEGGLRWDKRPIRDSQKELAFSMLAEGMKIPEIASELGVNKSTVYRWVNCTKERSRAAGQEDVVVRPPVFLSGDSEAASATEDKKSEGD